ncbi:ATPase involved in chromosome partitioning [Methanoregula formicica SMSP]|uniref:ATPase involved in chromosome partitioning n=2 Tax=Methanoregula formicica TaxID=882104 RepID=L0HFA0_METFS|nr:AAA family ATPase [Methanoregula formicica]AGB02665.1 ATPase involved in chromosome partitioning [Methanoregula formicica SMSP]
MYERPILLNTLIHRNSIQGDIITVIAFSHHKGGTGKTTSCLNIAGFLVQAGKKVLVIDCDPQANATVGLGFSPKTLGKNIYDVFLSGFEDFPKTGLFEIIQTTPSGIDLAPSSLDLVGADPFLYRMEHRAEILKNAIATVKDRYDFILVDTPPSLGQLVINGLFAADHVIVTLDSGTFALEGVSTLSTIFGDMKEDLGREIIPDMAVVTRWGEQGNPEKPGAEQPDEKDIFSRLRDLFYKKPEPTPEEIRAREEQETEHERLLSIRAEVKRLFRTVYIVPYSPQIYEAQKRGLPISQYAPESAAGSVYKNITEEVMRWS